MHELEQVMDWFHAGQSVLEIGSGHGWQAEYLTRAGVKVYGLEIEDSLYIHQRIYPVTIYDGYHIPLAAHSVDVVYSANVLLQIPHLEEFQHEIKRVIKPDGHAVFILPNAKWRFWTTISFYPYRLSSILRRLLKRSSASPNSSNIPTKTSTTSTLSRLKALLFPQRIGAKGNPISELYYLSTLYWVTFFEKNGWKVEEVSSTGLFYTGYLFSYPLFPITRRQRLARILGSVSSVYILRLQ